MLEALDIHKSFGGKPVLRGLSLTIRRGEVVALIGASGSGKSTLLRCLNRLETIDRGAIRIDGETLVDTAQGGYAPRARLRAISAKMGYVFQDFNLFPHLDILGNLTLPQTSALGRGKAEARDIALRELARVGLQEKARDYPFMLSGGQQQRAAIARALAMNPLMLSFDEPTSALDPQLTQEVLRVIQNLASEKHTMLVVTHEMGFAREVADRILLMEDGAITLEGPPAEVFRHPRVRAFARLPDGL